MKANLVRTVKLGRRTHYVYSCIDCGNEYIRAVYGKHINLYCADCNRKYLRERQKKQLELKQQAHDKQIRAEATDEELQSFAQWLWDSNYLVDEAFTIKLVEQYKTEQLKEQNND